jgi:bacterioferritin-associated ferredoxin
MKDVYICLCNGVKQSQIETAIDDGTTTLEALQETLEVAMNCGACTKDVLSILNNYKKKEDEADSESEGQSG